MRDLELHLLSFCMLGGLEQYPLVTDFKHGSFMAIIIYLLQPYFLAFRYHWWLRGIFSSIRYDYIGSYSDANYSPATSPIGIGMVGG